MKNKKGNLEFMCVDLTHNRNQILCGSDNQIFTEQKWINKIYYIRGHLRGLGLFLLLGLLLELYTRAG